MSHLVDAHVAYCKAIADLSQDKAELLERIKRLEEAGDKMYWTLEAEETGSVGKEAWTKAKEAEFTSFWTRKRGKSTK